MKKVLSALLVLFLLCGCASESSDVTEEETVEEDDGKVHYTNSVEVEEKAFDPSLYEFMDPNGDVALVEISLQDSLRIFSEGGTGVIIWGYPECYWCNRAMPILNEVALELGAKIYYVNADEGCTDEEFDELVSDLYEVLDEDEDGNRTMYVPEVVAVKDGKITGAHLSLVDSYDAETQDQLTDEQKDELREIYRNLIKSLS